MGVVIRGDLGITVIDLKTPATENVVWRAQLASYWHLAEEHGGFDLPVIRTASLMLNPKGIMARLKEYTAFVAKDFNCFLNALYCWRCFNV